MFTFHVCVCFNFDACRPASSLHDGGGKKDYLHACRMQTDNMYMNTMFFYLKGSELMGFFQFILLQPESTHVSLLSPSQTHSQTCMYTQSQTHSHCTHMHPHTRATHKHICTHACTHTKARKHKNNMHWLMNNTSVQCCFYFNSVKFESYLEQVEVYK